MDRENFVAAMNDASHFYLAGDKRYRANDVIAAKTRFDRAQQALGQAFDALQPEPLQDKPAVSSLTELTEVQDYRDELIGWVKDQIVEDGNIYAMLAYRKVLKHLKNDPPQAYISGTPRPKFTDNAEGWES